MSLGLVCLQFQRVGHDQLSVLRLCRQGVLQAQNAHLLVERLLERAGPGAVRLAAADEDRRATIAVTGGTATLLATELLAGAGDVAPFARGAGRSPAICEPPVDAAEQDVGARLQPETLVVELNLAAGRLGREAGR